jgi:DNA polymerase
VVGEGPGATEDETGRPFVGRAGDLLTEILAAIDLPRERVYICNVVKCRPPENRKPLPDEIESCTPYLVRQLALLRPAVILAMGATAAETLLNVRQPLGQLRNKIHRFRGIPLVVTYHPAALLRNPHWKKPTWDDVRIARQLLDQPD